VYIIGYSGKECVGKLLPDPRENTTTLKQVVGGSQGMRVYDPDGTSCILSAQGGGMGAKTGLYKIDTNKVQSIGSGSRYETDNTVWPTGLAGTLTDTDYKHVPKIAIKNATKTGYQMAEIGDGIDLAYPNSETRRGRVQPQQANTLTTNDNLGVLVDDQPIRIRKLTPKECWRLQGFSDAQYEKAAAVNSNSQLYKQAGNAVTVNVVEEIGHHIMGIVHENRGINK
jgi:DNA (cytosine-5)-methyltransferase 1